MTTALRTSSWLSIALLSFLVLAGTASAHSTISPSQTAPSKYETFVLSVPTERDVPTTAVRLVVPESLDRVTPFVKPGWRIDIKKEGERVTEVTWSGGSIPAGQKDVFQFTARTPEEPTTLIWKAYQTYASGEVVAWDQAPQEAHEEGHEEVSNPYSETEVVLGTAGSTDKDSTLPTILSLIATALSLVALWSASKKQ